MIMLNAEAEACAGLIFFDLIFRYSNFHHHHHQQRKIR